MKHWHPGKGDYETDNAHNDMIELRKKRFKELLLSLGLATVLVTVFVYSLIMFS